MVTLQDVTVDNWREVCALQVRSEQQHLVAPNDYSLLEARYGFTGELSSLILVPLAVYAGETLVGFAMYNAGPARDRFYLMRLMVDAAHQGKGYGRAAVERLLALFRAHPQAKEAALHYNAGNAAAARVYETCGFVEVARSAEDVTLWQALNPQTASWESYWNPGYVYPGSGILGSR